MPDAREYTLTSGSLTVSSSCLRAGRDTLTRLETVSTKLQVPHRANLKHIRPHPIEN